MSAMVASQRHPRQHATATTTSRNLLNLDCSADLRSYRRDLGPGVQAKCFEKTSDTIREQLDEHRAFLLRHRQNGQASGLPSPVPRLEALPSHTAPSSTATSPHASAPKNNYYVASQPRPLRMLSQPHAPQLPIQHPRRENPVPGRLETYPAGLQQALERCNQYAGHYFQPDTVWEVITDVNGEPGMSGVEVVGTYESLQKANMQAAIVFLTQGYYSEDIDPNPKYEVRGDGSLTIECEIEYGDVRIYIKSAPARRTLGPTRR
ncbi:hypothetical protein E8E13_009177 [Curvularia kusanoi]|uniref:Uncharacterized protein n=1 Tax=Curvularia kusanoi TaxID=90978 RepID=A0A9P4WDI9_CURKU|nr:hypothetical protein E8E13_009177 [Curvularia kusanoi]